MGNPLKKLGLAAVTLAGAATAVRKVLRREGESDDQADGPEPALGPSMAGAPDEAVEWLPDEAPEGDRPDSDAQAVESAEWGPPGPPDLVAPKPAEPEPEHPEPEPEHPEPEPEPAEPEPERPEPEPEHPEPEPEPAEQAPQPEPPEHGEPEPVEGTLDVNSASFEQLRGLGLSITLSKRIIAARDEAGGFSSLDELDSIPGVSMTTRAELHERLRV